MRKQNMQFHKSIMEICEECEEELKSKYSDLLLCVKEKPDTIKVVEQGMMTDFYYNIMLPKAQAVTVKMLKEEKIISANGIWSQIALKLKMPQFSYCVIGEVFGNSSDMSAKPERENNRWILGKSETEMKVGIGSISGGMLMILVKPLSNWCGVALVVLGGALLAESLIKQKNRRHRRGVQRQEVGLKELIDAQLAENKRLMKEWFEDLLEIVDTCEEIDTSERW